MTAPLGKADFFALEAGEWLGRMEALASAPAPDTAELVRAARAFRGSALMAGHTGLARLGAGFEAVSRSVRDGRSPWSPALAEQVAQAVDAARGLVRRAAAGDATAQEAAMEAAQVLEQLAGGPLPTPTARRADRGGVRAFVARESGLVAAALATAAEAIAADPNDRRELAETLRRMQPLRGLAELPDFTPLQDLLEGIELMAGELGRGAAPPPALHEVVDAAARALTRLGRDVSDGGRPASDSAEAARFAHLLLEAFGVERDVVPVESLLVADGTPIPSAPRRARPVADVELVSYAEHLAQMADAIDAAPDPVARDIRCTAVAATVRGLASRADAPVVLGARIVAAALRSRLADGRAATAPGILAAALREVGNLVRQPGPDVEARLRQAAAALFDPDRFEAGLPADAMDWPRAPRQVTIVPIGTLLLDPSEAVLPESVPPLVPIESLLLETAAAVATPPAPEAAAPDAPPAPPPPEAPPVPISTIAVEEDAAAVGALERSFRTLHARLKAEGLATPSLAALLAPRAPAPAAAPVAEAAVPIESLVYRGEPARARVRAARVELADALAHHADLATVRPLIDELLDLIPVALGEQ